MAQSKSKFRIEVVEDDLIKVEADVCVSSVHRSKQMTSGPLSKYIYKNAGDSVQTQLNEIPRDLTHGEVIKTESGHLDKFKFLLFACLYEWREGNDDTLRDTVKECCEIASKENARSICFPCLGTGGQKYPVSEAATAMMGSLVDFMTANSETSLEHIIIVLPTKDAEWLKTFVHICAKVIHMYNKGRKKGVGGAASCSDEEDFEVYIHDYEKLRNAKSTTPKSTTPKSRNGREDTAQGKVIKKGALAIGSQVEQMFGPLRVIGEADVGLHGFGIALGARVVIDVPILQKMFGKFLPSFFAMER